MIPSAIDYKMCIQPKMMILIIITSSAALPSGASSWVLTLRVWETGAAGRASGIKTSWIHDVSSNYFLEEKKNKQKKAYTYTERGFVIAAELSSDILEAPKMKMVILGPQEALLYLQNPSQNIIAALFLIKTFTSDYYKAQTITQTFICFTDWTQVTLFFF